MKSLGEILVFRTTPIYRETHKTATLKIHILVTYGSIEMKQFLKKKSESATCLFWGGVAEMGEKQFFDLRPTISQKRGHNSKFNFSSLALLTRFTYNRKPDKQWVSGSLTILSW